MPSVQGSPRILLLPPGVSSEPRSATIDCSGLGCVSVDIALDADANIEFSASDHQDGPYLLYRESLNRTISGPAVAVHDLGYRLRKKFVRVTITPVTHNCELHSSAVAIAERLRPGDERSDHLVLG